ncbi:MAG: RecX family transcriptional regulator [Nitrospirota bacterium]
MDECVYSQRVTPQSHSCKSRSFLKGRDKAVVRGLHDKARQYALRLLSYRGRSVKELEERLRKKGFPETVVSSTINHLRHVGLIDDMALAEALKREAMTNKLLGRDGVRRFMVNRGIPREIVDLMINTDETEEIENAGKLIDKKLRAIRNYPSEIAKRRLYNLLLRKGYSFDTIKMVLKDRNFKEVERLRR